MSWSDLGIMASILGVFIALGSIAQALILGRTTTRLQADIHDATKITLTDIAKGFKEGQQALGAAVTGLGQVLERIDQRADERHREVLDMIKALRG